MAGLALSRLAIDAVDVSARRQQFIPLTIVHLGNAGTATDGFDSMFTEAAQHAAEHLNFAETLSPDLQDANFVPGQIVESAFGATARDYEAFAGVKSLIVEATPPPAPTGPPPANPLFDFGPESGYPPHAGLATRTSIHGLLSREDRYGFSDI